MLFIFCFYPLLFWGIELVECSGSSLQPSHISRPAVFSNLHLVIFRSLSPAPTLGALFKGEVSSLTPRKSAWAVRGCCSWKAPVLAMLGGLFSHPKSPSARSKARRWPGDKLISRIIASTTLPWLTSLKIKILLPFKHLNSPMLYWGMRARPQQTHREHMWASLRAPGVALRPSAPMMCFQNVCPACNSDVDF